MTEYESNFLCGKFESEWGQDAVDFYKAVGVSDKDASAMKGLKIRYQHSREGNGKMTLEWIVDAMSNLNGKMVFEFGKACHINSPMVGGKADITTWLIDDNHTILLMKSEGYGTWVINEVYHEGGNSVTYMHKESGKTYTEKWARNSV